MLIIKRLLKNLINYYRINYRKQFLVLVNNNDERFKLLWKESKIFRKDATTYTKFDKHYTYHPGWAVRVVKQINPKKHIDISSIIHFSVMLSGFIETEFYDYRPVNLSINGLKCLKGDLTKLDFADNSIESLSCMHTIEHIGLGRYGDPIDIGGDLKAIKELKRVVMPGGNLLFVVPVGIPKLIFNAHRIYSYEMIKSYFEGFTINNFSLITDKGDFINDASPFLVKEQTYGCGCFWLVKNQFNTTELIN